jgi:hypothetical protein
VLGVGAELEDRKLRDKKPTAAGLQTRQRP